MNSLAVVINGRYVCSYASWMPGKEDKGRNVSFHSRRHFYVVYGDGAFNPVTI